MHQSDHVKLWTRDFILIILISLTTSVAMQVLNATMTLYVVSLKGSPGFSGTMATLFAVMAGAVRLISGSLSDRFSRRLFMIIGSVIFALSVLGFGLIGLLPALLVFRTIQGIGFSSVNTASAAATADIAPKQRLGEGLGYYSLGMAVAMALGPLFGLPLANNNQFELLYGICAGVLVLCLVFSIMSTYEKRRMADPARQEAAALTAAERPSGADHAYRGVWKIIEKKSLTSSIIYMFFCFSTSCLISFLPLYAKDNNIVTISVFYLVEASAMFLIRLLTSKVFDRRGATIIIIPSLLIGILAFILFDYVGGGLLFLIPAALFGAALGMGLPAFNALAVKDAPAHRRGAASATFMLFLDIGIGVGASIWGVLLDLSDNNYSLMFAGAAASLAIALVLYLIFYGRARKPAPKASPEKSAVLFDMDGVLVDSEPVINAAAIAGLAEYGIMAVPEDFLPFVGTGEDRYIGGVAEKYGRRYEIAMKDRVYQIYLEMVDAQIKVFDGVHKLLADLAAAGHPMALASSADRIKITANLRAAAISLDSFGAIISGEDVVNKKPAPDIYLTAAKELGIDPAHCVVVEDALNGIMAAHAAGMACIAVSTSFSREELAAAGADRVIDSVSEVPAALASL